MGRQLDLESSLQLKQTSPDIFENVHKPWTWWNSGVVPGGLLMAECAAAAYHTVSDGFVLDSLQAHFLAGPNANNPIAYKVQRLSNGKRFAVRLVTVEQGGKTVMMTTVSFVSGLKWTGLAMTHSVSRTAKQTVQQIELDDLAKKNTCGPFMKFERLPVVFSGPFQQPQSTIAPCVAQISPPMNSPAGSRGHILGIINLSDYHVLDATLTLSGITFGLQAIGDHSRQPTKSNVKLNTSLNHSIHFHVHDGFRADDLTYIEVTSPWAKDGRSMLSSRIFSKDGVLIATCIQEAFYVLKDDATSNLGSKL
jgi:acyl-CoA thioesterase II